MTLVPSLQPSALMADVSNDHSILAHEFRRGLRILSSKALQAATTSHWVPKDLKLQDPRGNTLGTKTRKNASRTNGPEIRVPGTLDGKVGTEGSLAAACVTPCEVGE